MSSFAAGEDVWTDCLNNLLNVVQQNLIGRQLANHVETADQVLDIRCRQGTQAIRLVQAGCEVVGGDPSAALLQRLAADAARTVSDDRLGWLFLMNASRRSSARSGTMRA